MNLIYGKAVGFFGNGEEHFDYVKEENFLQIGGLGSFSGNNLLCAVV
jgi:hypothetical protein